MTNILAHGDAWRPILQAFAAPLQPHQVEYLQGAGGFSGAEFWRLRTAMGDLCLRRWPPEHPNRARLIFIHQVLRHAASRGISILPLPIATSAGDTFVAAAGTLWELTPWLAGEGNFSRYPTPEKLRAALVALAKFHVAVADFPSPDCRVAPSPGIASRCEQLQAWQPSELAQLRAELATSGEFASPGQEIVTLFERLAPHIASQLAAVRNVAVPLQPVIRDVWADHLLFSGSDVTGLVDFGGMNIDTPATDIARLLGSMAGDDDSQWQLGLAAYQTIRPVSQNERQSLPVFDRSAVLLSGMNWLRWILLERRTFTDHAAIVARLRTSHARMRHLAGQL
jgi:homoserine kinase type II